jgi:hypothetical protein
VADESLTQRPVPFDIQTYGPIAATHEVCLWLLAEARWWAEDWRIEAGRDAEEPLPWERAEDA